MTHNNFTVLFVSSGNKNTGINPIVLSQAQSLIEGGVNVEYFTIKGKGIKGYVKSIFELKQFLSQNSFTLVHAHYSLSAFVASLAGSKPLVVSLMGSDVKSSEVFRLFIRLFSKLFSWKAIIVKSDDMKVQLGIEEAMVIPNGVDTDVFFSRNKEECQETLGWQKEFKHILFAADPARPEKNFSLASTAVSALARSNVELNVLKNIPHSEIPIYINAADLILLTSLWEGSPNVIKEAMACSKPIVCTNVGDVRWLLSDLDGCFITSFDSIELKEKIELALQFSERNEKSDGTARISELMLDKGAIAQRIIKLYETVASRA